MAACVACVLKMCVWVDIDGGIAPAPVGGRAPFSHIQSAVPGVTDDAKPPSISNMGRGPPSKAAPWRHHGGNIDAGWF